MILIFVECLFVILRCVYRNAINTEELDGGILLHTITKLLEHFNNASLKYYTLILFLPTPVKIPTPTPCLKSKNYRFVFASFAYNFPRYLHHKREKKRDTHHLSPLIPFINSSLALSHV